MQHSLRVENEFSALESKVTQVVTLCERLREENVSLREQLVSAQDDAKRLNVKIDGAKTKLEQLISRIPG